MKQTLGSQVRRSRNSIARLKKACFFDALEERNLFSLLNVVLEPPTMTYATGTLNYNSTTHNFVVDATPLTFRLTAGSNVLNIPATAQLHLAIQVDNSGALIGGVAGNDLTITGSIDMNGDTVPDYSGTLLTGEISGFGFIEAGATDRNDFTFTPTGGDLYSYFIGTSIAMNLASENSTFSNSFSTDFTGGAKGSIGPWDQVANAPDGSVSGRVFVDSNNNGFDNFEPGINGVTILLTGTETGTGNPISLSTTTANVGGVDGVYSFGNLNPGTYTITEVQPVGYDDGLDSTGSLGGTTGNDVTSNIVIGANKHGLGYNFGELTQPPGSLSGSVFLDNNNDGTKNGADSGIAGVSVTLSGTTLLGASVNITTTTDANGNYTFATVAPGMYSITENTPQPTGTLDGKDTAGSLGGTAANDVITAITVGESQNGTAYTFAEIPPASLAGFVYNDANNDGTKQGGESGISGASVTLTGTDDLGASVSITTTTNASGAYSFGNLRPGSYTITETQPAGFADGIDAQGTPGNGTALNDKFQNITLATGGSGANNNFGEIANSSLSGFVYNDTNNDGTKQVTETGIAGVTVTLTGTDDLGAVSISTTTDANGAYSFGNLRPGTYTIHETQPGGVLDGKDTQGTPGNGTTTNDNFTSITMTTGFSGANNNFGELPPASLSGFVYEDANNDGIKQVTENGINNVTVTLTGTDDLGGAVSISTTTDSLGAYTFGNLRPGDYTIHETQPAGFPDGKDTQGTPGNGTATNDNFAHITLGAGISGGDNNFGELTPTGNLPPTSLGGFVFNDANNDGIKQGSESGIAGVTITLTGTDDTGAVSITTTTDANGAYSFINLRAGTYTITETQPGSFLDGKDTQGTPGNGTATNDKFSSINLSLSTNGADNNFGEIPPAMISGIIFNDANHDGIKQSGESFMGGVTVLLTGTNDLGPVSLSTTTSAGGAFAFSNLRPGTYVVKEVVPAGFTQSLPTGPTFYTLAPGTGAVITNNNFGNFQAVSPIKANSLNVFGTANKQITNTSLAIFTDPNKTPGTTYTALISWGDGLFSNGLIVGSPTGWRILGTHTYKKTGVFKINVKITGSNGATALTNDDAEIFVAAPLSSHGVGFKAVHGKTVNSVVAAFTDGNPNASLLTSGYAATIFWGDGTSSSSKITSDPKNAKQFYVNGSHIFAKAGTYSVRIVITNAAGSKSTVFATATVS